MNDMVTLRCPEGAWDYPISSGTVSYFPYRADITSDDRREFGGPWLVDVPADIAHHFLGVLGFVKVEAAAMRGDPIPTVRMRNAHGAGCSFRGYTYEPDGDGVIVVPMDAMTELASHGFAVVSDEPDVMPDEPEPNPEPVPISDPAPSVSTGRGIAGRRATRK
jgi:hypothetical protein